MNTAAIVLSSSAVTIVGITIVAFLSRNIVLNRLHAAVAYEYNERLENAKSMLRKETEEALAIQRSDLSEKANKEIARFQAELDDMKALRLVATNEKIEFYKSVYDILCTVYSDLFDAYIRSQVHEVKDRYNSEWPRIYGYLSLLASIEVMDAFNEVNERVLGVLDGSREIQHWEEVRPLALRLVNAVRRDLGIAPGELN
jgi:hypothetical protein